MSTFTTAIKKSSLLIPLIISLFIMAMDETTTVIALSKGAEEMNPLGFNAWAGLRGIAYLGYLLVGAILINKYKDRVRLFKWFPLWGMFVPYICLGIYAVVNNMMVIHEI